ncbi:hypothetical protein B0H13DRAFT_2288029 [Mycena leptocephala]|nr:hypothetical protein B0H13DRAFT_2288029 [Mycena leptocephala]
MESTSSGGSLEETAQPPGQFRLARQLPDEIISEILTPLLEYSDELFSDYSGKALLEPGYSSSNYLRVCKAWLCVWDKLQTFHFPYIATVGRVFYPHPVLSARAEALALALVKSPSLENLSMCEGDGLPAYIRQMVDVPSLKSLHFIPPPTDRVGDWMDHWCRIRDGIRIEVNSDPKLNALVTYADSPSTTIDPSRSLSQPRLRLASEDPAAARVFNLTQLTSLAESSGRTLEELEVTLRPRGFGQGLERTTKEPREPLNPLILAAFVTLTRLTWNASVWISFSTPPFGFSALHNLKTLSIENESPSVLDIGLHLPLNSLRVVDLSRYADITASIGFLQRHGSKLLHLSASLQLLIEVNALMENFFAASTPHPAFAKLRFDSRLFNDSIGPPVITMFERLEPERFPTLKEIQFTCLRWPTSEEAVRRSKWIQLSEVLRTKSIRLVDANGIGGTDTCGEDPPLQMTVSNAWCMFIFHRVMQGSAMNVGPALRLRIAHFNGTFRANSPPRYNTSRNQKLKGFDFDQASDVNRSCACRSRLITSG